MDKIKTILYLCATLCFATTFYAQTNVSANKKKNNSFEKVTNLYLAGKLNDTVYMKKMDSVANVMLDKGIYFEAGEFAQKFKIYEKIAWEKYNDPFFRNNYYLNLFNNVYMPGNFGGAMYYAEKISKESKKRKKGSSLFELSLEIELYGSMGRNDKVIAVYEKQLKKLEDFAEAIKKDPDNFFSEGMVSMRIFQSVLISYYAKKDSKKIEKTANLAKDIIQSMNKAKLSDNNLRQLDFYLLHVNYIQSYSKNNYQDTFRILNAMEDWVNSGEEYSEFKSGIMQFKIDAFLETKQADSAFFYIKKLEKDFGYLEREPILVNKYKAQAEIIQGNYQKASDLLLTALDDSFEKKKQLSEELDNLLYAQVKAEHHKLAFEKSEAEKKERNTWIIVISFLLIAVIAVGVTLLRLKDRKLKKTVKDLNETANIQIALMEEFESEVRKEEQERLSQNLHDDLAGILAAVKYNIDLQVLDTEESDKKEKLVQLSEMMNAAFNKVRNKSHDLFEDAQLPNEEMFYRYIMHLAHIAFPENHYKLNIQIDDYSLANTSIEFRSELIRVIQEAFTNIIKHAKASQVDLWIYREIEKLCVVIKDNGKGINSAFKENTMGIGTMKARLKKFQADFTLNSDDTGVEITISIPENTIKRNHEPANL